VKLNFTLQRPKTTILVYLSLTAKIKKIVEIKNIIRNIVAVILDRQILETQFEQLNKKTI